MIDMNETRLCALEHVKAFLQGTGEVRFQPVEDDEGRYSHLQAVLKRFAYPRSSGRTRGWCCAIWVAPRAIHGSS